MTAVTVVTTTWAALDEALRTRRPLWVTYHRRRRLICRHALGFKAGRAMVLGYQTGGETSTGALHPDPAKGAAGQERPAYGYYTWGRCWGRSDGEQDVAVHLRMAFDNDNLSAKRL